MPRDDAARLIAKNLHNLAAPPGGKRHRLMQYSAVGHTPEVAAQITASALEHGKNLIHLLESHGYTVSHQDDPKPGDQLGAFPTMTATCKHCGDHLIELAHITNDPTRPGHLYSSLHRTAIESAGLKHSGGKAACWE